MSKKEYDIESFAMLFSPNRASGPLKTTATHLCNLIGNADFTRNSLVTYMRDHIR